jgi:hypothetical protein
MGESSIGDFVFNRNSLYIGKISDNVSSCPEWSGHQNLLLLESRGPFDSAVQSSCLNTHHPMIHEIDHGGKKWKSLTPPNEKSENLFDDPFHHDWPYW